MPAKSDVQPEQAVIVLREEDYEKRRTIEPDEELKSNVMALAFPPPVSDEDMFAVLAAPPPERPSNFKELSLITRLEWLDRLDEFHHPFQRELDFMHKAISLLRKGLRPRNPTVPGVMHFILEVAQGRRAHLPRQSKTGGGGGLGLFAAGPSGVGKTSLLDRLVAYLDERVRVHLSLGGRPCKWTQLGPVRIAVQSTWSATLDEILRKVDSYMRTDFYTKNRGKGNKELLEAARSALTSHLAPVLILDEFQRLGKIPQNHARAIIQGLIDIMEHEAIPVILVGTVASKRLLELFPAELGKFCNGEVWEFEPLFEEDPDTHDFIEAFQEQHISVTEPQYSVDFEHRFLLRTMGIRRAMREYAKAVFRRHAHDESLIIDGAMLDDIAEREMKIFEPALDALRKFELGFRLDFHVLQQFEDFLPKEEKGRRSEISLQQEVDWIRRNHEQKGRVLQLEDYDRFVTAQRSARTSKKPAKNDVHTEVDPLEVFNKLVVEDGDGGGESLPEDPATLKEEAGTAGDRGAGSRGGGRNGTRGKLGKGGKGRQAAENGRSSRRGGTESVRRVGDSNVSSITKARKAKERPKPIDPSEIE